MPVRINRRSRHDMNPSPLSLALDRAERAIGRIEQSARHAQVAHGREVELREKVQGVVAELDEMIRSAGAR